MRVLDPFLIIEKIVVPIANSFVDFARKQEWSFVKSLSSSD